MLCLLGMLVGSIQLESLMLMFMYPHTVPPSLAVED